MNMRARTASAVPGSRERSRRVAALMLAGIGVTALVPRALAQEYRVTIGPALETLRVEARLPGEITALRAGSRAAGEYLRRAERCDGRRLVPAGRELRLGRADSEHCVRYTVDLEAASEARARGTVPGTVRSVSPSSWLWLPRGRAERRVEVAFSLPADLRVSVPWEPVTGAGESSYRIPPSPESAAALTLFGDFHYRELEVPGSVLRVSMLKNDPALEPDTVGAWLRAVAGDVARVYGRFPNPSPQIIVVPVSAERRWSDSPVPFGRVVRNGGEAVQFFIDADRGLDEYLGDWTASHEFSHLFLPYLSSRHKWVSEGFASYYQYVVMARGGRLTEADAWRRLFRSFERARREGRGVSPNAAARLGIRRARMMIYWSGAAFALLADAELRRGSDGKQSLDTVLAQLGDCCLPSGRRWSARELFSELDRLAGEPVFMTLYETHADAPGLPRLERLAADLGIEYRRGRLRLLDDAPASAHRRAIMSGER